MNKKDEAYRSMVEKVLLMLERFLSLWKFVKNNNTGNKQISDAYNKLKKLIKDLDKYIGIQKNVAKGLGQIKNKKRNLLNKSTFIIYGIIRSYALAVKNEKLYIEYKASMSTIKEIKDTEMEALAAETQNTISKYKTELLNYGLSQDMIDKYAADKDAYIKALSAPGEAKAEQRFATDSINRIIGEMRSILDNRMDTYMVQYMETEPEFYETYQFARIIYDNPTQHYSLMGIVKNKATGLPEQNVKVTVKFKAGSELADKVKSTSANGIYIFKKLEQGKCKVVFSKNYFDTLVIDGDIYDNQANKIDALITKTV